MAITTQVDELPTKGTRERDSTVDISYHDTLTSASTDAAVIDLPARKNDPSIWARWKRSQQHNLAITLTKHEIKEYGDDFLEVVREPEREAQTLPKKSCINSQPEITWFVRESLVGFLIEVHSAYRLRSATAFLAVNLLDRYCSKRIVGTHHYQLVGCVALLVAAKYRERQKCVPSLQDLSKMCQGFYTPKDFVQAESLLLSALEWNVEHLDTCTLIQTQLADKLQVSQLKHMSMYIAEIALFDRDFVDTQPSVLASSAQALARYTINHVTHNNVPLGEYDPSTFLGLYNRLRDAPDVLVSKYAKPECSGVSLLAECLRCSGPALTA
ncbi:hypothetical protein E8E12_000659 [Didymella heteroderae]|uniref:Cyclin N-terminal domain-containing protein n=1 Tax=Didymella heteroderae TaxID=1769908 RepID=A0A9P5BUC3_9PLEO|nr:hypothetical protein E8E12_000659 [Didymella heteroderae]